VVTGVLVRGGGLKEEMVGGFEACMPEGWRMMKVCGLVRMHRENNGF